MPELPEVETIVRRTRDGLVGRRVVAFESRWPKQLAPSPEAVEGAVVGRRVAALGRRAKWIVMDLEEASGAPAGWLLVHLRMSGRLEWLDTATPPPAYVRTVWTLDDGRRLALDDMRKFGRIVYTTDITRETAHLGVEPFDPAFTPTTLAALLRGRRRAIKPSLLDQGLVAGLGNIYVDEALHRARVHPLTPAERLGARRVRALHEAIRHVLTEGIRHNGTSIDWIYPGGSMQDHLHVYGREGQPCRTCGAPIEALRVAQRGTHVCPRCQRRR